MQTENPYEPTQTREKIPEPVKKHTATENIVTVVLVFALYWVIWYIFQP